MRQSEEHSDLTQPHKWECGSSYGQLRWDCWLDWSCAGCLELQCKCRAAFKGELIAVWRTRCVEAARVAARTQSSTAAATGAKWRCCGIAIIVQSSSLPLLHANTKSTTFSWVQTCRSRLMFWRPQGHDLCCRSSSSVHFAACRGICKHSWRTCCRPGGPMPGQTAHRRF